MDRRYFTELELDTFRECFSYFDKRADGKMQNSDVALALRAMGALVEDWEVKELVMKYDPDNRGCIQFDQYEKMLADVYGKPDSPKEVISAFQTYDKTSQGLLDVSEMKHVLTRIGDVLSP